MSAFLFVSVQAQYINSLTFHQYFTKQQVDSVLVSILGSTVGAVFSAKYPIKVYTVNYNTYDVDSNLTTASGLLVVPQGTPCEVPMLSFQHTNIIRKSDAPSRFGDASQWFIGLAAGSLGNITLMPDGLGLGSGPGFHPFLHAQTEATSVIDMIRAVREVVDTTGSSPNEQLFLAGISEGASAALAAHEYIQTYLDSTEMHVTATGCIAGYYDMSGSMVNMILSDSIYPDPSYLPDLLLGYNSAYNFFAHDSDIMAAPYDSTIPPLFNGYNRASTIDAQMPSVAKYILRQDQIDSLQNDTANYIRQLLKKNDLYNWAPTSPVKLLYCIADEYVPFQNSIAAYTHFVANGATQIDTVDVGATYDHNECSLYSIVIAISIINQFTHQPIATSVSETSSTSPSTPNGTATVSDTLGDPPYTIHWSTGDSTATISGLSAGTYYVTVTDNAHCTNVDSAVIELQDGISEVSLSNINIYPNPTQGLINVENKNTSEILTQILVADINGNVISAPYFTNGKTTEINLGEEAKGVYILTLRSQSGKELHRKVVLL
jgi:hypothetical protein